MKQLIWRDRRLRIMSTAVVMFRILVILLDLVSIGLVAQLASALVTLEFPENSFLDVVGLSGMPLTEGLLALAGSLLILIFVLRAVLAVFSQYLLARLARNAYSKGMSLLWEKVIGGHETVSVDGAQYVLTHGLNGLIFGRVIATIVLMSEAGVVLAVCAVLAIYDPVMFAAGLVFVGVASAIYSVAVLRRVGKTAQNLQSSQLNLMSNINDTWLIRHELKIMQLMDQQRKSVLGSGESSSRSMANLSVLHALPRYYFELVAVLGLFSLAVTLLLTEEIQDFAPTLAVYTLALFRVVSALIPFQAAWQTIIDSKERSRAATDLLSESQRKSSSWRKTGARTDLVEKLVDLATKASPGDIILLTGASGSGKTTAMILAAETISRSGMSVSFCPQSPELVDRDADFNLTLRDAVRRDAKFNPERVEALIQALQLEEVVSRLHLEQSEVANPGASGGEKQRIGILRALALPTQIAFLDEPSSSVQSDLVESIAKVLRNADSVLVVSSHDARLTGLIAPELKHRIEI